MPKQARRAYRESFWRQRRWSLFRKRSTRRRPPKNLVANAKTTTVLTVTALLEAAIPGVAAAAVDAVDRTCDVAAEGVLVAAVAVAAGAGIGHGLRLVVVVVTFGTAADTGPGMISTCPATVVVVGTAAGTTFDADGLPAWPAHAAVLGRYRAIPLATLRLPALALALAPTPALRRPDAGPAEDPARRRLGNEHARHRGEPATTVGVPRPRADRQLPSAGAVRLRTAGLAAVAGVATVAAPSARGLRRGLRGAPTVPTV